MSKEGRKGKERKVVREGKIEVRNFQRKKFLKMKEYKCFTFGKASQVLE